MADPLLTPEDLTPFAADIPLAKAQAMIADAVAMAARVAPCITSDEFADVGAAKAILRGAVLRWNDSGSGAVQTQTTGPYSTTLDNRQQRRGMFWPSEITDLQDLCKGQPDGAFSVGPASSPSAAVHASVCPALSGGACLCGAALGGAGIPTAEYCYGSDVGWRA